MWPGRPALVASCVDVSVAAMAEEPGLHGLAEGARFPGDEI